MLKNVKELKKRINFDIIFVVRKIVSWSGKYYFHGQENCHCEF